MIPFSRFPLGLGALAGGAVLALALAGCSDTMTALHRAAMSGDVEVVKGYVKGKRNLDPRYDEPTRGLEGNYARVLGITQQRPRQPIRAALITRDEQIERRVVPRCDTAAQRLIGGYLRLVAHPALCRPRSHSRIAGSNISAPGAGRPGPGRERTATSQSGRS